MDVIGRSPEREIAIAKIPYTTKRVALEILGRIGRWAYPVSQVIKAAQALDADSPGWDTRIKRGQYLHYVFSALENAK